MHFPLNRFISNQVRVGNPQIEYYISSRFCDCTTSKSSIGCLLSTPSESHGTCIATYGKRFLGVNLGWRRDFPWPKAIIPSSALISYVIIATLPNCMISLAVKFTSKSIPALLNHSAVWSPSPITSDIHPLFRTLTAPFPHLTCTHPFSTHVQHDGRYHIVITCPPTHARPRRLAHGKSKSLKRKAEFDFRLAQ